METNLLITLVDIPCMISLESLEMVEGEKMLQAFLPLPPVAALGMFLRVIIKKLKLYKI